jgi:pyrimidine operon attenuation protein/uracil phosphoribosyltransferase
MAGKAIFLKPLHKPRGVLAPLVIFAQTTQSLQPRLILDHQKLQLTIDRLCYQLIENHKDFVDTVLIGLQPRGIHLSHRVYQRLKEISGIEVPYGLLDITFYRDDYRTSEKQLLPQSTTIRFSTENKKVVMMDDVLFSGRTVRAAMDAILDYGRPAQIELLVLIDRRFTRELPIEPNYVGKAIDSLTSERVMVEWKETSGLDQIWIVPAKQETA